MVMDFAIQCEMSLMSAKYALLQGPPLVGWARASGDFFQVDARTVKPWDGNIWPEPVDLESGG
jgi:hypothetical protein